MVPRERFRIHEIGTDYILGVATDELGVEYVRMFRLDRRETLANGARPAWHVRAERAAPLTDHGLGRGPAGARFEGRRLTAGLQRFHHRTFRNTP